MPSETEPSPARGARGKCIKTAPAGYAPDMREAGKDIGEAKARVKRLTGIPLVIRVSEGRGRSTLIKGSIVAAFPAVFTVRTEGGEIRTFSYADVHTHGVMFLRTYDPDAEG